MKDLIRKYKHALPILAYLVLYLIFFFLVERYTENNYHLIHVPLDDKIPFLEIFVIPYFCWFAYVAGFVFWFIFFDKDSYWPLFWFLVSGMTLFLIVSAVYPNGQELRPAVFPRDNLFTRMIAGLYETDTPTNLLPSIHVYNSVGVQIAVMKSAILKKHRLIQILSGIMCILIVLSTMFIKQHSVVDVVSALALSVIAYGTFYVFLPRKKGNSRSAQNK